MSPGPVRRQQHPVQQRLGLLGRVQLQPVLVAQPLRPGAEREQPVAAHLHVVVQRLHRLVVEPVARIPPARRPDHRLVRVGEAPAAEIRHRIRLAPDHVVEDPEPQLLQDGADAENVVIGTDHPDRAVLAQQPAALGQPLPGERVIGLEVGEPVPVVVHPVHQAVVGPAQLAAELQVVRRVGEDAVDRRRRQHAHDARGIAQDDLVQGQLADDLHGDAASPLRHCEARWPGPAAPRPRQCRPIRIAAWRDRVNPRFRPPPDPG